MAKRHEQRRRPPPDASQAPANVVESAGLLSIEKVRALAGIDLFKGLCDGSLPMAPMFQAMGFHITDVSVGSLAFTYEPTPRHYNPLGTVHGGIAAALLDSAMGCSIHTMLKPGLGYTTLEIKVNYVRPMTEKTGPVRALGRVISMGSRIATSEGRVTDTSGKLLAHGTTTCMIFPI